jgi:hypothetical protein
MCTSQQQQNESFLQQQQNEVVAGMSTARCKHKHTWRYDMSDITAAGG